MKKSEALFWNNFSTKKETFFFNGQNIGKWKFKWKIDEVKFIVKIICLQPRL